MGMLSILEMLIYTPMHIKVGFNSPTSSSKSIIFFCSNNFEIFISTFSYSFLDFFFNGTKLPQRGKVFPFAGMNAALLLMLE